jgi:hypothetical protein
LSNLTCEAIASRKWGAPVLDDQALKSTEVLGIVGCESGTELDGDGSDDNIQVIDGLAPGDKPGFLTTEFKGRRLAPIDPTHNVTELTIFFFENPAASGTVR